MAIPDELLDSLLKNQKDPEDLIGKTGLLKQLTKQLLERTMAAEMTGQLRYEMNSPTGKKTSNPHNGSYQKRIKGEFDKLDIAVTRDRDSCFEPMILPKGQSRFTGSTTKSSPCMPEGRPLVTFRLTLTRSIRLFYLDDIRIKVRQDGQVINKAIGINLEGLKEVLGLWTAEN